MIISGLPAATPLSETAAFVLTQQPGSGDNGGQGEDAGKASPIGLVLLILFLVAVVLLVRSMSKHLKRVPASFDKDGETEPETDSELESEDAADESKPDAKA